MCYLAIVGVCVLGQEPLVEDAEGVGLREQPGFAFQVSGGEFTRLCVGGWMGGPEPQRCREEKGFE